PLLSTLGAQRVLFIVDEAAFRASAASQQLRSAFQNRDVHYFSDFEVNPKLPNVEHGLQVFQNCRPDVVVALGGGTTIDMAKLIRGFAGQQAQLSEIVKSDVPFQPADTPLVVLPTTAGTGSEATHFAVVYLNGKKYSVAHARLLPNHVVVDPTL